MFFTKIAPAGSLPALQCDNNDGAEGLRDDAVLLHATEDLRKR